MPDGAIFYAPVINEERLAVLIAMTTDVRDTRHLYYGENGYPFTIGERGLAMKLSKCSGCGSLASGQDHQAVTGVIHPQDLEAGVGASTRSDTCV
jgi:hypothetical protein